MQELQAEEKEQNAKFAEEDAAVAQYVQAAEATAAEALVDLQRGGACSREDHQLQEASGGQGSSASRATQQDSILLAGFTLAVNRDRGGCASPLTLQGSSTPSRPLRTSLTVLSSR